MKKFDRYTNRILFDTMRKEIGKPAVVMKKKKNGSIIRIFR